MKNSLKNTIVNLCTLSTIIFGLSLTSFAIAEDNLESLDDFKFEPQDYRVQDCEWRYEGCVKVDKNKLDLRSTAKVHLDSIYACKNTIEGCTKDEMEAINSLKTTAYSQKEFSALIHKLDPGLVQQKFFIPLGLKNKELLMLAASSSLGLVLFPSDQATMDFVQDHKSEFTEKLVLPTNEYIKPISLGVAAGSYFVGAVMEDNKLKSAGLYVVTAGLASQMVTELFKRGFGRQRPIAGEGPYAFGTDGKSFFSGHSSGAWSMATVFAEVYKDHKYIPYVAYSLAALTSYGRLHDRKHYLSDVFYGAVAGHLMAKLIMRIHKRDDSAGGFEIYPSYDIETGSVNVNFKYVPAKTKEKWKCTQFPEGSRERIRACIQEAYVRSEEKGLLNKLF